MLLFGRRLYWLFVGIVGFLLGAEIAAVTLAEQGQMVVILVAVAAGVIGAVLAILLQRAAFALAGLLAGGFLGFEISQAAGWEDWAALVAIVLGVIGCIAAIKLTDWAIIALSALAGAAAIAEELPTTGAVSSLLFLVLLVFGMAFQGSRLKRTQPSPYRT